MNLLKQLREEKRLSQRGLSDLSEISRGRLRGLEKKGMEEATWGEIRRISKALGLELSRIFPNEKARQNGLHFKRAMEPFYEVIDCQAGCRLAAFFPPEPNYFAGKLFLAGQKCLTTLPFPSTGRVFIQMLLGSFRVDAGRDAYEIAEGDILLFRSEVLSALTNTQARESVALFLVTP